MSLHYLTPEDRARTREAPNPFREGRMLSGMTQEELAEYLHVDARTVRRYEAGELPVPDLLMMQVAELPGVTAPAFLMHRHYKEKYAIADEILPSVQQVPLAVAVINLLRELRKLEEHKVASRLLDMADNGTIDPEEEKDYDFVMKQLDGVRRAVDMLRYAEK